MIRKRSDLKDVVMVVARALTRRNETTAKEEEKGNKPTSDTQTDRKDRHTAATAAAHGHVHAE